MAMKNGSPPSTGASGMLIITGMSILTLWKGRSATSSFTLHVKFIVPFSFRLIISSCSTFPCSTVRSPPASKFWMYPSPMMTALNPFPSFDAFTRILTLLSSGVAVTSTVHPFALNVFVSAALGAAAASGGSAAYAVVTNGLLAKRSFSGASVGERGIDHRAGCEAHRIVVRDVPILHDVGECGGLGEHANVAFILLHGEHLLRHQPLDQQYGPGLERRDRAVVSGKEEELSGLARSV